MRKNNLKLSGGVGWKLFTAFLAVSLFSLASALVGWVGLGVVRQAQNKVLDEIYPSVRDAQIIAQESTVLVLQLTSFFEARSLQDLSDRAGDVTIRRQRISKLLVRFDANSNMEGFVRKLSPKIKNISQKVERLSLLSRQTILDSEKVEQMLVNILNLSEKIVAETTEVAPTLGEKTIVYSGEIIGMLQSGNLAHTDQISDVFENFTRRNLDDLHKATDLQFRSEAIRDHLLRLRDVTTVEQLKDIRHDIVLNLRGITDAVVGLNIPNIKKVFSAPLADFSEQIFAPGNIFSLREKVLTDRSEMDAIRAAAETVGRDIGQTVDLFVLQTQNVMDAQSSNAQFVAIRTQFILLAIAALAFCASVLIYYGYIDNNIIYRLQRLSSSVFQLTGGDLTTPVAATGDDQITQLEEAVEAFRGNAIRLQTAERDLLSYANELERSNTDLQQFAYVTSHDLRAPLRAITSLSEWVEEDLAAGNTVSVAANLSRLRGRVKRMESLLSGILQYARAGSVSADNAPVDITAAALQIFDDLNHEGRFSLSVKSNVETVVTGESFLYQVLGNLISNAIKHHDKQTGAIEIEFVSDDASNTLTVSDDGSGIPENFRSKVFQMFQTLKPRDEMEASGIGLALVKRLVERRHGQLSVGQSVSGGACFAAKWPVENV